MNRHTAPFNGDFDPIDEAHAGLFRRGSGLDQTAEIVVIGERPEIDAVTRCAPGHHLRWQKAVRNDGMAVEIEIGWRHG